MKVLFETFETMVQMKKIIPKIIAARLDMLNEKRQAENRLATFSSWGFVRVFSSVATELSEIEGNSYVFYLQEAEKMLLKGEDPADVLWHFEKRLTRN